MINYRLMVSVGIVSTVGKEDLKPKPGFTTIYAHIKYLY